MANRELQQSFVGGEMAVRMFGRPGDIRYQHGAEKLQNFITMPQGPAQKRPGTSFVREIKNSANRARLIPFQFSQDQTLMIEMGRDTVDSREIGYFRFHTQGSTLLFTLSPAFIASSSVSAITVGTDLFTTPLAHAFNTGDPILFTIFSTAPHATATFAIGTPGIVTMGNNLTHGQQLMFDALGGGGTLPPELTTQRIYYASNPTGADTRLSESRFGPEIAFSTTGSVTVNAAWGPHAADFIDSRTTYYFINISATSFKIATSRENALAGTAIDVTITFSGAEDLFVSFHYRVGDLVTHTNGLSYYLFRSPLGDLDSLTIAFSEIAVAVPTDTSYWVRLPGAYSTVTFDTAADEVDWIAHPNSNGDTVIFSGGTPPTGIVLGTVYFIVQSSVNAFKVAATPGGAVIDMTGAAAGSTTALAQSIFEAPHFFTVAEILELSYAQSNDVLTLTHPNRPAIELTRRGATNWTVGAIRFNQARPPPDVDVTPTSGAGFQVTVVTAATPAVLTTNRNHGITALVGTFMVKNVGDIPDGIYTSSAVTVNTITLAKVGDHTDQGSGTTTVDATSIVQPGAATIDFDQIYVVTSVGANNEESGPSDEVPVVNFILADGAFNTITWSQVGGAEFYRIYKKENGIGVFGVIGEVLATQPLTFKDDNVGPSLSTTPPILDESLRKLSIVAFDAVNMRVNLTAHGLEDGQAVAFQGTGPLPVEITEYQTFFVVESTDDSFAIASTVGGTPIAISSAGIPNERYEVSIGLFPTSVAYFEQRRVFGGSLTKRQRVSMTAVATESDLSFSIPTVDSDRIRLDVAAREAGAVRHVVPLSHLMILSSSTEYRVTPINSDALTPSSVAVRGQSFVGASKVQPAIANNVGVFAANRGGHVRELGFPQNVESYLTGDLSLRATHLFNGLTIEQIAYAKAPQPIIWCVSSGGRLLGLTYLPEEQVLGWHRHETDGTFESCAVISEGEEDHLYVIVKRTINSLTVRYVERMAKLEFGTKNDAFFVDAGITYNGVATTTITGLDHLEGETVNALADGVVVLSLVVSGGQVTLATAASKVQIGLSYLAEVKTLPVTLALPAGALDKTKNVNAVWLRVEESGNFQVGFDDQHLEMSEIPAQADLLTKTQDLTIPPSWTPDGQVLVRSAIPLPLTLVSLVYEVQPGG